MTPRSSDLTLLTAIAAAVFSSLVSAVYTIVQAEPSSIVGLFLLMVPTVVVALWLQKDARQTGVAGVQDWGYFLLLAWPFVIPWYAFRTRGVAGWRLTAGLFLLILSGYLTAVIVSFAMWYFGEAA